MPANLVYLRPKPVAYVRIEDDAGSAPGQAWTRLHDWCRRAQLIDTVRSGYGIASQSKRGIASQRCVYDAAIDLPVESFRGDCHGLAVRQLPGGAYLRQRLTGVRGAIPSAIAMIAQRPAVDAGLELDVTRPVIEIFTSTPWTDSRDEITLELLLPISAAVRSAA